MNDGANSVLVIDAERAVLVGTQQGLVLERRVDAAELRRFEGLEGSAIRALAASVDGRAAMACDAAGRAATWERGRGELIDAWTIGGAGVQCAILGARAYLTVDARRRGALWTAAGDAGLTATPITERPGAPCGFDRFGVSADGGRIVLLSGFRWMRWDPRAAAVIQAETPVNGMQLLYMSGEIGLSPDGRWYYVYWDDYTVIDTETGVERWTYPIPMHATATALSGDGQHLAVGGEDGRLLVLGADGRAAVDLRPTEAAITQVSIGAEAALVAFVDAEGGAGVVDVRGGAVALDRAAIQQMLGS